MVIMKFGEPRCRNATAIERVAEIVRSRQTSARCGVSAFAKVTDQLVLMGQQATSGEAEASLQLLETLRVSTSILPGSCWRERAGEDCG